MAVNELHISRINVINVQHDEERREIQQLNDTFAMYLKRVQNLEEANKQLSVQILALRNRWVDPRSQRHESEAALAICRRDLDTVARGMQSAQVQAIRANLDKASIINQISFIKRLMDAHQQIALVAQQDLDRTKIELESYSGEVGNKKAEIEQSKIEMGEQLKILKALNKRYDDELMARVVLESELQTLREELLFLMAVFEEEKSSMLSHSSFQIDINQFYQNEIKLSIAKIKNDFAILSEARYKQWEDYYKLKINYVSQQFADAHTGENLVGAKIDIKTLATDSEKYKLELAEAHKENGRLSMLLQQLEDAYEDMKFEHNSKLTALDQMFASLLAEYNELQAAISNIHENNVSLQFEISAYRCILEGVYTVEATKTRDIAFMWKNTLTAAFSAMDTKSLTVLRWAENIKAPMNGTLLTVKFNGPKGYSGVSFSATYYTSRDRIVVEANIADRFNFSNYGEYQVTIYYANSTTIIGTWSIHVEPASDICMPKELIIRNSINQLLPNTTIQISASGKVVFTGKTNENGAISLPRNLPQNCYDIEVNTNMAQYKATIIQRIMYPNKGADSITVFIYRQMQPDEVEFLLMWGEKPKDLDSHLYVSDGRHVYFQVQSEKNVSLDCDCRDGSGPETIKVKLEPNMKYVYAVHRFSKDGELARSNANVTISTNENVGAGFPYQTIDVPYVDQPDANFWVVCQIDGRTKKVTLFDRKFENQDDFTQSMLERYYSP
ncbi:unnamed protein product [Rotaria socialis]|uniref:IF rod domain-containing protein n=1 Tax=Rotaria socialis TaxID=392032 RepID=A0A821SII7_9BILA|nr:unnamed protein product [Rotaria socialis]CAF3632165.1 unnamed protein product [Rotaria socialis]CAF3648421.1 unnamed protein product [Rotaria socialis]CAF3652257.1 unnamed protein product [Rotaria socialis]CAF3677939.1 unnamed protein product [Rotaria socialis]